MRDRKSEREREMRRVVWCGVVWCGVVKGRKEVGEDVECLCMVEGGEVE